MDVIELTDAMDFHEVEHGDLLIVQFKKPPYPIKHEIETFRVFLNKVGDSEIILRKKDNIYFNWKMFLVGQSHVIKVFKVII